MKSNEKIPIIKIQRRITHVPLIKTIKYTNEQKIKLTSNNQHQPKDKTNQKNQNKENK